MPKSDFHHLNGHIVCAVDVETTGLRAGYHEVIQLAIVPLTDDLEIDTRLDPLCLLIRPDHPNRMDAEALRINQLGERCLRHGIDHDLALELFQNWFNSLGLEKIRRPPWTKLIQPLAHNWSFDKAFLEEFFGLNEDHKPMMNNYFDYHARDTACLALYLNDLNACLGYPAIFPKYRLSYLCERMKLEHIKAHDALSDAMATALAYKRMCEMRLPVGGVDINT